MDQLENQELLLKQHLRDMQAALMQKEAKLKQICRSRELTRQDYAKGETERCRLEADLEIALKMDKDEIGRMLIKKLKPLTGIQADRSRHIDRLTHEIRQLRESIEEQRMQYEQLHQKAAEYFHRSEQQRWQDLETTVQFDFAEAYLSEEEIEFELRQRKETAKGGGTS
jgi:phage shock protein A